MSIRWRSDWNPLLSTHPRWIYDYGFGASFDSSYSVWALIHRVGGMTQTPALSPNMDRSHFMLPERRDPLLLLLCCCCCFFLTNTAVIPINSTLHPFYRTTTSRLAGHVRPREEEERFVGGFGLFIWASVDLHERPRCCCAISTQRLFLNQWAVTVRWLKTFHLSWDTEHCFGQDSSVKFGCRHYKSSDKYELAM